MASFRSDLNTALGAFARGHCFEFLESHEDSEHFGNAEGTFESPEYLLRAIRDRGQYFLSLRPRGVAIDLDLADLLFLADAPELATQLENDRSRPLSVLARILTAHFPRIDQVANPAIWQQSVGRYERLVEERARRVSGGT